MANSWWRYSNYTCVYLDRDTISLICQYRSALLQAYIVLRNTKTYLDILHCFLYQCFQASVCVCTRGVCVTGPVWSQVADHQVEVVPLQSPKPEGLADGTDLRQTHAPLVELGCLLFQPGDK